MIFSQNMPALAKMKLYHKTVTVVLNCLIKYWNSYNSPKEYFLCQKEFDEKNRAREDKIWILSKNLLMVIVIFKCPDQTDATASFRGS